jgi:hypothetical protein
MTSVPSKYSLIKISSYDTITPSSPTYTSNRTDKAKFDIHMQMVFNLSDSFFLLFDYLLYERFEDTKGVIRIRKLKKSRLYEWGYAIFIFLSSFMTYHRVYSKSDSIGVCG